MGKNSAFLCVVLFVMALTCPERASGKAGGSFHLTFDGYSRVYARIGFEKWGELKESLTVNILRGNDMSLICKRHGQASEALRCLALMKLTDDEREDVRDYLIGFMQDYLSDPRVGQLIADSGVKPWQRGMGEAAYDTILAFPSKILCVVAAREPKAAEVERIGDFLMKYHEEHDFAEYYLREFLSEMLYFGNIATAEAFLSNRDFSAFTDYGNQWIDEFRMAVAAYATNSQEETWRFLQRDFIAQLQKVNGNDGKALARLLDRRMVHTNIVLSKYKSIDFSLLVELCGDDNEQNGYYYVWQLFWLVGRFRGIEQISLAEKEAILQATDDFLNSHGDDESPFARGLYGLIKSDLKRFYGKLGREPEDSAIR